METQAGGQPLDLGRVGEDRRRSGRTWEGPDALILQNQKHIRAQGAGSWPEPTSQNPTEASILTPRAPASPGGPAGPTGSCPGARGRGPERGGRGPWLSPRGRGAGLRKGRVDGERGNAQPLIPGLVAALLLGCRRARGGRGLGHTQAPGGKAGRRQGQQKRAVGTACGPGLQGTRQVG